MMEMMESSVNVTCAEIQISDGFEFRVPADRFTHFHQSDCEQLWYSQDGRLMALPENPHRLIDPVISVSSDRLVTSRCFRLDTIFRDQWWCLFALFIIILILILICVLLRKRILRCFQRAERFISQREAPDNTDQATVGSTDPGIGSANQFSESAQDFSDMNKNPSVCQCWMMEMMESSVNVTCAEIQISDGFEFRVPADRFTHFHQSDCEQLWYSQDGRLMALPENPHRLIDPVISVTSDRLVTSRCVDELLRNQTAVTPNSDQWWCLFALFIIILILILICILLRKRILRCFQRAERFISQREAPDNMDLATVGSTDPGISSANQFSESAQ
ncbi:NAD kinase [Labeo rohita]|uniref:NAD kinase n=1 Tax=Labeo rohita TaxID=84645 RepID=A0ABQ8MVH5_LABRO|nr:NAD kinase [Labeo rohita]